MAFGGSTIGRTADDSVDPAHPFLTNRVKSHPSGDQQLAALPCRSPGGERSRPPVGGDHMPHIDLPEGLPGILGPMHFRPRRPSR